MFYEVWELERSHTAKVTFKALAVVPFDWPQTFPVRLLLDFHCYHVSIMHRI